MSQRNRNARRKPNCKTVAVSISSVPSQTRKKDAQQITYLNRI